MSISDVLKNLPALGEQTGAPPKPTRQKANPRKRTGRPSLRTYTAIAPESDKGCDKRLDFEDAERECLRRARRICQARFPDVCTVKAVTAHHRKLRSQGGGNEQSNLIAVCRACHRKLHNAPALAAKLGLTKHRRVQDGAS